MTDSEARQVVIKVTELRMSPLYQSAEALRRRSGAEAMARADPNSNDYAAIWLLIATWEKIAIFIKEFNDRQRRRFFQCNPVRLVWRYLEAAVLRFRESGSVDPAFAAEFEALAREYERWTRTRHGQEFRTEARQVVCALFA